MLRIVFWQGVGAHPRVVRGEGAILEGGVAEEVRRGHRHLEPGLRERLLEVADDLLALGRGGVDRDQVVVVEVDAVGAHLGQQVHELHRRQDRADGLAERVAAGVADGPEAERELVLRLAADTDRSWDGLLLDEPVRRNPCPATTSSAMVRRTKVAG